MKRNRYEKSLLVAGFFKRVIRFSNLVNCFCLGKISLAEYKFIGKKQNSPNNKQWLKEYKEKAKTYWIINRFYSKVWNHLVVVMP